jgi:alpha-tubulin suppressor-like RCC1 family protein
MKTDLKPDVQHSTAFPKLVSALQGTKVIQVECGAHHTLALTADKEVYSWGMGSCGRLGHGSEDDEMLPRRIESLRNCNIISIAAGYDHSAAISAEGRLWMWGFGGWNQLGTGDKKNALKPTLINIECNVKQVSCGGELS